ncbi:MAG: hypothetical protein PHI28_00895 [Mangrovibacterium sp.]|nr:hypothetical protein [Mangrovibacterium sp.]
MKRRNFIATSAAGFVFLSAKGVSAMPEIKHAGINHENSIDPIVPFRFYRNRKDFMLGQMVRMKQQYGLRRFLLTAPMEEVRLTGFPSVQVYQEIGELLLEVKNKLEPHGIEVGWWCAPSLRSGKGGAFQYITDLSGIVSETSPCPLDPGFREVFSDYVATVVRIARPFMVQFEDDYELSWQPPSVRFGCFCPFHLAEFSKRQGRSYSREQLMGIFRTVTPESMALRRSWAVLSRDSLASLAALIRQKVDRIAPETRISLCQSGMADFDGDFTEMVTRAFAGNTRPVVRLYGTSYSSDDAQSLPENIFHALYSRQHLPDDFEFLHESDTYPHTRFFMSAAKIKSLMTAAFSYHFDDSLFYATQYLDAPLEEEGYCEMFRAERKRWSALKEVVKDCRVAGCEIVHKPFGHIANPYKGGNPGNPSNAWIAVAGRFGIPYTSIGGKVKLVSGNLVTTMDDQEIKEMLSGGVFLDGKAAFHLCEKGWGEWIGADVRPGKEASFCYEGIRSEAGYRNIQGQLMYNLIFAPAGSEGGSFYEMNPLGQAERITDFLDQDEKPVVPGLIRFGNKWGGRVAITAFNLEGNRSSAVFNYKKKEIVRQTIEWLGKGPLPVFVTNHPNVFCICNRSDSGSFAVVTLISLCSDPFDSFSLDVSPRWINSTIKLLDESGNWQLVKAERKEGSVKINVPLGIMSPVILKFHFANR